MPNVLVERQKRIRLGRVGLLAHRTRKPPAEAGGSSQSLECITENLEQRQAKWRNFYQASGGKLFVVCDNRSRTRNIRSEINYSPGNKPLVVSLTNLADLQAGKRGEGDRILLEVNQKGSN